MRGAVSEETDLNIAGRPSVLRDPTHSLFAMYRPVDDHADKRRLRRRTVPLYVARTNW